MKDINGVQSSLLSLLDIDLKLGRIDEAKQVAAVLREMTGIFDLWDYCAYLGDFEIATAQKDAAAGMKILEKMLPAMLKNGNHTALRCTAGSPGRKMAGI